MRSGPRPIPAGPGQESVWDYPRPPRLEPVHDRLRVVFAGTTIADTTRGFRVLETSHPPVYYFPRDDVLADALVAEDGASLCEWKGRARFFTLRAESRSVERAAWIYPTPAPEFSALAGAVAFYPALMDACMVGDEIARPQPGGFYGGWITDRIVGPFKGDPGTHGW